MRPFIILIIITFSISLNSCDHSERILFGIADVEDQNSDFIFMAESSNIIPIDFDSLSYYLTTEEFASSEKVTYKNFGRIYENENFRAFVILREGSKNGRDYKFIIRTIGHDSKIIDSYVLAIWTDEENQYCYGLVDNGLSIWRKCKGSNEKEINQILNNGKIVTTSFKRQE